MMYIPLSAISSLSPPYGQYTIFSTKPHLLATWRGMRQRLLSDVMICYRLHEINGSITS